MKPRNESIYSRPSAKSNFQMEASRNNTAADSSSEKNSTEAVLIEKPESLSQLTHQCAVILLEEMLEERVRPDRRKSSVHCHQSVDRRKRVRREIDRVKLKV